MNENDERELPTALETQLQAFIAYKEAVIESYSEWYESGRGV